MLGVKTIGNATLIAFDERPVLVTDPWLGNEDEAYFGSWTMTHIIPQDVEREILDAEYVWFSHGHPDHLNPHSKKHFLGKKILLPDHLGGRIKRELEGAGFHVTILPDRTWIDLSAKIKVLCISDYLQDALMLVDINGRLFVNLNDTTPRGSLGFIRKITRQYRDVYLLKLSGYGDADMINFYDVQGNQIEPSQDKKVGQHLSSFAQLIGANHVIPFSSFHRYQRKDSVWANAYSTPIWAYEVGFDHSKAELIKPFVFVDCTNGDLMHINPKEVSNNWAIEPIEFGDDWNDRLASTDIKKLTQYFVRKQRLHSHYRFINFRVGQSEHRISLNGPEQQGITFEVPRSSLMKAIEYEIFDDLLIGNFMKTTLHGVPSLYDPPFTFITAKFGDNGKAETDDEVKAYLNEYRRRNGFEFLKYLMELQAATLVRRYAPRDSMRYRAARSIYFRMKRPMLRKIV